MGLLSRGGTEVLGRLLPPQEPQRPLGADVFRPMAVGMVGWFHFWQQTWINPGPLHLAVRTGYIWVDGMILLSAFCLWLPYARARAARGSFPGCEGFWRRRALRILPCYYAAVLLALLLALRSEGWSAGLGKDLAAHLTLTHTLFPRSYLFTSLGSVTWTVGVLAGFYLLFPLLARAFWRWPLGCLAALCAGQLAYSWGFALKCSGAAYQMAFNQLPAFLGVWAIGMAGAELYEALCRYAARLPFRAAALAVGLAALWCVFQMQKDLAYAPNGQRWQLVHRLPLALLQCIALLGLCLGPQLPGRRLWQWLAAISYNFYLWHQSLAVWLKYRWHLPPWAGDTPPNQLGDANWQQAYNLLCWGTALLVSALMTWYVERPAAAWLKRRLFAQKAQKLAETASKQP